MVGKLEPVNVGREILYGSGSLRDEQVFKTIFVKN
jgi:hypothetical protein